MVMYLPRSIYPDVKKRLENFPVVGIIGPRQVGKTTLVRHLIPETERDTVYLDLESISDMQKLDHPELYLKQHENKCVIIDEIQNKPDLFPLLRSLVDKNRTTGRFIILGSASPQLLRQSSESLAGRISYVQLSPFNYNEISDTINIPDHWLKGGYPPALLAEDIEISWIWLNDFINSYAERDLPALGFPGNPVQAKRIWTMLAHLNGQVLNYSDLANSLQLSSPTIRSYIDFFENAFLIRKIQPYFFNIKKRIVKSPKLYLQDTGILHQLLNIQDAEALHGYPYIGYSWEAYVINQIAALINPEIELCYYRTKNDTELDLVFVKNFQAIATAEIKYTSAPKVTAGNTVAIKTIGTSENFIITPDSEEYPARENIRVCGIQDFLNKYLPD